MQYVAGLMFSEDGTKVAMVLKNKPAWQAGKFNGIGGKIELDELPIDAMVREFEEETGVKTTASEWNYFVRLEGPWGAVSFFTLFSDKVFDAKTIEEEAIHVVDSISLPLNIIENIRWLVPLALDRNVVLPPVIRYT